MAAQDAQQGGRVGLEEVKQRLGLLQQPDSNDEDDGLDERWHGQPVELDPGR